MKTLHDIAIDITNIQSLLAQTQSDVQALIEAENTPAPEPTPVLTVSDARIIVVRSDDSEVIFVPQTDTAELG